MRNSLLWLVVLMLTGLIISLVPQVSAQSDQPTAIFDLAPTPDVTAQSVYVVDATLGTTLYELNADEKHSPASLTKMATALTVLANIDDIEEQVTIDPADVISVDAGESIMGIVEGDVLTVHQLLQGLLLESGNDAALALARHTGEQLLASDGDDGDPIDRFVQAMNDFVAAQGLTSTHFTNPAGLYDEENYSTARELATLATLLHQNEILANIVDQPTLVVTSEGDPAVEYDLANSNKLLGEDGVTGIKTGTLPESGACLAASKTDAAGTTLIGIVLGSDVEFDEYGVTVEGSDKRFDDMRMLFDSSENDYRWMEPGDSSLFPKLGSELSIWQVTMKPAELVVVPTTAATDLRYRLQLGPVGKPEEQVGQVIFYAGDRIIAQTPVIQN